MPGIKTIWPIWLLACAAAVAAGQNNPPNNDASDDAIAVDDESEEADDDWVVVDEPGDDADDDDDDDDEVGGQARDLTQGADGKFLRPPPELPVVARPWSNSQPAGAGGAQNANNTRSDDTSGLDPLEGLQIVGAAGGEPTADDAIAAL